MEDIRNDELLESELRALLNRYSRESESGTPDYILASYLMGCLENFEKAMNRRIHHAFRMPSDKRVKKK